MARHACPHKPPPQSRVSIPASRGRCDAEDQPPSVARDPAAPGQGGAPCCCRGRSAVSIDARLSASRRCAPKGAVAGQSSGYCCTMEWLCLLAFGPQSRRALQAAPAQDLHLVLATAVYGVLPGCQKRETAASTGPPPHRPRPTALQGRCHRHGEQDLSRSDHYTSAISLRPPARTTPSRSSLGIMSLPMRVRWELVPAPADERQPHVCTGSQHQEGFVWR